MGRGEREGGWGGIPPIGCAVGDADSDLMNVSIFCTYVVVASVQAVYNRQ
jgi:hypothetical protein